MILKTIFTIVTISVAILVTTAQCEKTNDPIMLRILADDTSITDSCYIDVRIDRFDSSKNDVSRIGENLINGRRIYGIDCGVPRFIINSISIRLYETNYEIGQDIIGDCGDPRFDTSAYKFIMYRNDGALLIFNGSDGAGSYTVMVILSNNEIIKLIDYGGIMIQKLNI